MVLWPVIELVVGRVCSRYYVSTYICMCTIVKRGLTSSEPLLHASFAS